MIPRGAWLVVLVALLGTTAAARAANFEVDSGLEPEVAGIDDVVTFWIEVRGGTFRRVGFEPHFQLDNLEQLGPPSQSQNMSFINGVSSSSLRLIWRLRPLQPGTAAVRSIEVEVGGERVDLPDRHIEIRKGSVQGRSHQGGRPRGLPPSPFDRWFGQDPFTHPRERRPLEKPKVFLRAEITPGKLYVGQQALYRLYLYTQADISAIQPTSFPDFRGFWAEEIPQPKSYHTQMVNENGRRFGRVALLERALFPLHPGTFEIEPAALDLVVQGLETTFFGSSLSHPERLARESNRLRVTVDPLPDPPPRFSGAVGDLDLEASLEPRELQVGEAATLTLTIEGDGHIQSLAAPELPAPPGLKIFPPQETSNRKIDDGHVQAKRTWSYVVVPEHRGSWKLDPPDVPFFDPRTDTYRVAAAHPLTLAAHPGPAATVLAGDSGQLHSIRSAAVPIDRGPPWHRWLPWLFALPLGAALAVGLARRRGQHRPRAPAASGATRRRLTERLEAARTAPSNRQAAGAIEEAWREHLASTWNLAAELPVERWSEALVARGLDEGIAGEVARLGDDLHYLRYAPQLSASAALREEILDHSRRLVRRLR